MSPTRQPPSERLVARTRARRRGRIMGLVIELEGRCVAADRGGGKAKV
jgi:hypothetical protein